MYGTTEFASDSLVVNHLLTKLAWDRTGRLWALGLFRVYLANARSVLSRHRADILPVRPSHLVNKI